MSLELGLGTKPEGLTARMPMSGDVIFLGDYEITMEDFLFLAAYALQNSDLNSGDPRRAFIEGVKEAKEVPGYNEGGTRIVLGEIVGKFR